jgi:hypothetical protein
MMSGQVNLQILAFCTLGEITREEVEEGLHFRIECLGEDR